MKYWEEDDTTVLGLKCNFVPKCPFDESVLTFHDAKVFKFALEDGGEKKSHATDVDMLCPTCGYNDTFGVAISEERYYTSEARVHKMIADAVGEKPDIIDRLDEKLIERMHETKTLDPSVGKN